MVDFSVEQRIAYNIVKNSIRSDSISHAYLVNTNNYSFAWDFVIEMVKSFLCPDYYLKKNSNCDLCRRIENDNYPEFRVVNSDGLWIKKNQILDLQNEFNKVAIEGNKRVYVVKDADRMNQHTSNSILKFLEEPNNDVIAILVTDNINLLLPTIVSRCQLINLSNKKIDGSNSFENFAYLCVDSKKDFDSFLSDSKNKNLFDDTISFIEYYETNGLDTILYSKDIWHSRFKDRIDLIKVFDLIINFYYDVLLFKFDDKVIIFKDKLDFIKKICDMNEMDDIIRKINVSIETKNKIKYNVNLNLFFDKYILLLGGNYNESSSC